MGALGPGGPQDDLFRLDIIAILIVGEKLSPLLFFKLQLQDAQVQRYKKIGDQKQKNDAPRIRTREGSSRGNKMGYAWEPNGGLGWADGLPHEQSLRHVAAL